MNRRKELDRLLADTLERFEGIVASALEEIEGTSRDADAKVRRYEEAREALDNVEGEISALEAEREELPERAYEANLHEDPVREAELRARFRSLPGEIDRLESHRDRLRAELASLRSDPAHPDPDLDALRVRARQAARPSGVAFSARGDLRDFRAELVQALEKASAPVDDKQRATRGWVETVNGMIDDRTRGRQRAFG